MCIIPESSQAFGWGGTELEKSAILNVRWLIQSVRNQDIKIGTSKFKLGQNRDF